MFLIDCSEPVDDKNIDISKLEKFRPGQIKVSEKPRILSDSVSITRDKGKITINITTAYNFSKRYITIFILRYFKYLIRQYNLYDWLCVIAPNKDRDGTTLDT